MSEVHYAAFGTYMFVDVLRWIRSAISAYEYRHFAVSLPRTKEAVMRDSEVDLG